MSAAQTPTERKVSDLQVGDVLVLGRGPSGPFAALITRVEQAALDTQTVLTFLVQPNGEDQVIEDGGPIDSDYTVEVL